MANKKITLKNYNGVSWDELYPKTKSEQVITTEQQEFITKAEKDKLAKVAINANNYVHPDTHPSTMITGLSKVATSGSYEDLKNTPSLPTFGTAAIKNTGTTSGTIPLIGTDNKLDARILPAIAISDTFVVASQAAMLAVVAETGDIAVRTDLNKTFILKSEGPNVLGNWQELLSPISPVQSVAGKTGTITLSKADVELSSVDNTSDANKPISTATQNALILKATIASPSFTGTPKAPTAAKSANSTQIATTQFVQTAIADVTAALGTKIIVSNSQPPSPVTGDIWYELEA